MNEECGHTFMRDDLCPHCGATRFTLRLAEIDAEIIALKEERRNLMETASRAQDILLLKDNVQVLENKIDVLVTDPDRKRVARQGIEAYGKLMKYKAEVGRLLNRADNSADEIALLESLTPRLTAIARRVMIEVFDVEPERVDNVV